MMDDKNIINSLMELPESPKKKGIILENPNLKKRIKLFRLWIISWYWKLKHIFKCEEKYMTEKALMRICHKCGRITITDKRLIQAYKKGGMMGLLNKKKEIVNQERSTEIGSSR